MRTVQGIIGGVGSPALLGSVRKPAGWSPAGVGTAAASGGSAGRLADLAAALVALPVVSLGCFLRFTMALPPFNLGQGLGCVEPCALNDGRTKARGFLLRLGEGVTVSLPFKL